VETHLKFLNAPIKFREGSPKNTYHVGAALVEQLRDTRVPAAPTGLGLVSARRGEVEAARGASLPSNALRKAANYTHSLWRSAASGSLWLPIRFRAAENFVEGPVYGMEVKGHAGASGWIGGKRRRGRPHGGRLGRSPRLWWWCAWC